MKDVIILFCKKNELAKKFKKLVFYIGNDVAEGNSLLTGVGELLKSDFNKGTAEILIAYNSMEGCKNKRERLSVINRIVVHELTHAWDYGISRSFKLMKKTVKFFEKKADKLESRFKDKNAFTVRVILHAFLYRIKAEGFAEYFSKLTTENSFSFDKNYFGQNYVEALKSANEFEKNYQKELEKIKKGKNELLIGKYTHEETYVIGFHMFYSIMFLDDKADLIKVAKLRQHKFMRKYEKVMIANKMQPVMSLTSGRGVLDYKRMVEELSES